MSKKLKIRFAEPEYDYSNRKLKVDDFLPPRNKAEYKKFIKRLNDEFGDRYDEYMSNQNIVERDGCRSDTYLNLDEDYDTPNNKEEFLLWNYRIALDEAFLLDDLSW